MRVTTQVVIYVVRRPSAAGGTGARFMESPLPLPPAHTDHIYLFYQRTILQSHTALHTHVLDSESPPSPGVIRQYRGTVWGRYGNKRIIIMIISAAFQLCLTCV